MSGIWDTTAPHILHYVRKKNPCFASVLRLFVHFNLQRAQRSRQLSSQLQNLRCLQPLQLRFGRAGHQREFQLNRLVIRQHGHLHGLQLLLNHQNPPLGLQASRQLDPLPGFLVHLLPIHQVVLLKCSYMDLH